MGDGIVFFFFASVHVNEDSRWILVKKNIDLRVKNINMHFVFVVY